MPEVLYYRTAIPHALNIIASGRITYSWARTVVLSESKTGYGDVCFGFRPEEAFRRSTLFKNDFVPNFRAESGSKFVDIADLLESVSFDNILSCGEFFRAAGLSRVTIPKSLKIFVGNKQIGQSKICERSFLGQRDSIVKNALSRFVCPENIPPEFFTKIDDIIRILSNLHAENITEIEAKEDLLLLKSEFKTKDSKQNLPEDLINEFVGRTLELRKIALE